MKVSLILEALVRVYCIHKRILRGGVEMPDTARLSSALHAVATSTRHHLHRHHN